MDTLTTVKTTRTTKLRLTAADVLACIEKRYKRAFKGSQLQAISLVYEDDGNPIDLAGGVLVVELVRVETEQK